MRLHPDAYMLLRPTDQQSFRMARVRAAAKAFSNVLEAELADGHDKAYVLRTVRTAVMWANTTITRDTDGSPRMDGE